MFWRRYPVSAFEASGLGAGEGRERLGWGGGSGQVWGKEGASKNTVLVRFEGEHIQFVAGLRNPAGVAQSTRGADANVRLRRFPHGIMRFRTERNVSVSTA